MYLNNSLPCFNSLQFNELNRNTEIYVNTNGLSGNNLGLLRGDHNQAKIHHKLDAKLNFSPKNATNLLPCKLCGQVNVAMKCNECLGMQLCFVCDNMYHRHPKRKNHIRKSINVFETNPFQLPGIRTQINQHSTTNYISYLNEKQKLDSTNNLNHEKHFSKSLLHLNSTVKTGSNSYLQKLVSFNDDNEQLIINKQQQQQFKQMSGIQHKRQDIKNSFNNQQFNQIDSIIAAHPSNMPIPPPRRKKFNKNSLTASFSNQFNEIQAKMLLQNNSLSSSCSNINQLNNSYINLDQETNPQLDMSCLNRRFSLEDYNKPNNQHSLFYPTNQNKSNQHNFSFNEANNQTKRLNNGKYFLPYNAYENFLSKSMNELVLNNNAEQNCECSSCDEDDFDNYSSNSSIKRNQKNKKKLSNNRNFKSNCQGSFNSLISNKRSSPIRRCQSSSFLIQNDNHLRNNENNKFLPSCYYDHNFNYRENDINNFYFRPDNSFQKIHRKNSVKSFTSNKNHLSDFNENASSKSICTNQSCRSYKHRKYDNLHKSEKLYRHKRSKSFHNSKNLLRSKSQTSNHITKSSMSLKYVSSNDEDFDDCYDQSDFDYSNSEPNSASENEKFESFEQEDSDENNDGNDYAVIENVKNSRKKLNKKKWKCKHCTFVNRMQMRICEMCSKSNLVYLNRVVKKKSSIDSNMEKPNKIELNTLNTENENKKEFQNDNSYFKITDELIKQQHEVEKEILRRIENEKKIKEENLLQTRLKNEQSIDSNIKQTTLNNDNQEKDKQPSFNYLQSNLKDEKGSNGRHREATGNFQLYQTQQENKTEQPSNGSNQFIQQYDKQLDENKSNFLINQKSDIQSSNTKTNFDLNNNQENQYDSLVTGMKMFKILRDAERKNYLAEEVEIALDFNPMQPIVWLDENWSSMKETVLSLANNQLFIIANNEKTDFITIDEEDAVKALRNSKGNIWSAVNYCVKMKKRDQSQTYNCNQDVKSFAFNLNCTGLGSNNVDGNLKHVTNVETKLNDKYFYLENLLNSWCDDNFIEKESTNNLTDQIKKETNVKVKELIQFLKKNGLFDTNKQTQQDIEEQLLILIDLIKKKLNSNNDIQISENEDQEENENKNPNENKTENDVYGLNDKLKKQFDEIDEKMKENLVFFQQLENKNVSYKLNEEINTLSDTSLIDDDLKKYNVKSYEKDKELNLTKIRTEDNLQETFNEKNFFNENNLQILEELNENNYQKPVNQELDLNQVSNEFSKDFNKAKGKIKIIRRKIFRRNSADKGKSFEEVSYIDNFDQVDNSSNKNICQKLNQKDELQVQKSDLTDNSIKKQDYNKGIVQVVNYYKNNQLIIDDEKEKKLYQLNPNFGYAKTVYECELCTNTFHINELISMLFCTHQACRNCLEKYFTIQIREKQRILIKCPFCDQPEITSDDEDSVYNYLNLLEELIKNIVSKDLYELFQQKVRDRTLQKDPSFKWCSKCGSGFLVNKIFANIIRCPDCKILICSKCNEIWRDEHQMLTCEQFKQWLINGDEWLAEHQLNIHMNQYGIRCPKCDFHYELSKGGCMHFHCIQCEYDFCSGCNASFKMGDKCLISMNCEKLGFHAHHPRNCMFYLRDKGIDELEKLLELNNIDFNIKDFDENKLECDVIEQKEISDGLKDESCKRSIKKFGLCSLHYVEYLGSLIKQNHIDPIVILNEEELINIMKRESIEIPKKCGVKKYREKLIETIMEKLPIT